MPDPENVPTWYVYVRADTAGIGIRLSDVEFIHSVDHRAVTVFRLAPHPVLSVQRLLFLSSSRSIIHGRNL